MNESDFIYWAFVGTIIVVFICNAVIARLREQVLLLRNELQRQRETVALLTLALEIERQGKRSSDDADWWKEEA